MKSTIIIAFTCLALYLALPFFVYPQDVKTANSEITFHLDVISFRGETDSSSRVDVFAVVPYQSLNFMKSGENYSAQYDLIIKVLDSSKTIKEEKKVHRIIKAKDYNSAQGSNGEFDYSQTLLSLTKGNYEIKVIMIDNYTNGTLEKSRSLTILNFAEYPYAISGIMLLSSIEEQNGKFKITPYISDNVGDLKDGFFTFFESYNKSGIDSVDFIYQISDMEGKVLSNSKKIRKYVGRNKTQLYLKIPYNNSINFGNYNLRIIALKPSNDTVVRTEDYIAAAERSIGFFRTMLGFNITDLNKAVKQLRYIAMPSEIEYIESAQTQNEKQVRFLEFWDNQDPSPKTDRNEAFEEYYTRVDNANKEFRSYNEGWLTDMGWVYIVYGKPFQVERSAPGSIGRKYERWTYLNNKQFVFVDNTGFGDFRLATPATVNEKYKYK